MRLFFVALLLASLPILFRPALVRGDEFTQRAAIMKQYKKWLDGLGPQGSRFWTCLDSQHRPYRLYLGKGFYRADFQTKQQFVKTFSSYLAGVPNKFELIDLFDANTNKPVGEYGFGGFKLYARSAQTADAASK